MNQSKKIYAVDFDGTLCVSDWPNIGMPITKTIDFCKREQKKGHKLILWTCRSGSDLQEAIDWCRDYGLEFDAVNENTAEQLNLFSGKESRKIFADYYIDDHAVLPNSIL